MTQTWEDPGPHELADPEAMARVVVKLERADLKYSDLTTEQITAMLTAIATGESSLKELVLKGNELDEVDPEVLAGMVTHVEELDLEDTSLTTEQVDEMISKIRRTTPGKLRRLILAQNDLSGVYPGQLSRIVTEIVVLCLKETELRTEQVQSIMTRLAETSGKLKMLVLKGVNLKKVKPELIAGVVTEVEWLNIKGTRLTTVQINQIFETIAEGPGNLRTLKINYNDLRGVDPYVMADAVNSLDMVQMSDMPFLTRYQVKTILTQALEDGTYLNYLMIRDGDYHPDYDFVDEFEYRNDFLWGNISVYDNNHGNQNTSLWNELFGPLVLKACVTGYSLFNSELNPKADFVKLRLHRSKYGGSGFSA